MSGDNEAADTGALPELGTAVAAQRARTDKLKAVSERKLKANRENARKSTGPKTPRGKTYSRRNAVKHGLFIQNGYDLIADEDPQELPKLHRRLLDELQPVGPTEESAVQHIVVCWLRLQRLWRYENAEIELNHTAVARDVEEGGYLPWAKSPSRRAKLQLLNTAEKEAETTGQISPETKKEILSEPTLLVLWPYHEAAAEKTAKKRRQELAAKVAEGRKISVPEAKLLLQREGKSLPEYTQFLVIETVREARDHLVQGWWRLTEHEIKCEYQRRLIPDDNETDKIIRYQNAFERQLSRAYDWLERLQRRRKGEHVPPPVSVRLTQ